MRIGAKAAVVEGRITVPAGAPAARPGRGGRAPSSTTGALLISRTVSAEGRSRAHVGGRSVPVGLLAELADDLVAVHGQTDQQGLLRPPGSGRPSTGTRATPSPRRWPKYAGAYRRLRAVAAELDELTTRARERAQEADLLRFGLEEIAAVEPRPGEDAELAAEAERLGHAEALASAATAAHAALAGNPEDPEGVDAGDPRRRRATGPWRPYARTTRRSPRSPTGSARCSILLSDVAGELAGYADDLDADPLRLAAVEERRAALDPADPQVRRGHQPPCWPGPSRAPRGSPSWTATTTGSAS